MLSIVEIILLLLIFGDIWLLEFLFRGAKGLKGSDVVECDATGIQASGNIFAMVKVVACHLEIGVCPEWHSDTRV
jgi:hypothetical protein